MNLSNLSLMPASRSLCLAAGITAAVLVGCGDDDDSTAPDGGRPEAGRSAAAGSRAGQAGAAGKGRTSGAGGARAVEGSGGKAGAPVVAEPAGEEDAGVPDVDAGSDIETEPVIDRNPTGFRDLSIEMSGFADEVGQYVQLRLIGANGELLTMAAFNGLPSANYTFELPDTIPPGQKVELQVWADTAGMSANTYDAAMDHAWTQTIAAGAASERAVVKLAHGPQMPPPTVDSGDAAGSLGFMLMGTNDYFGDLFELRIYENVSGRLVARYLQPVPGIEVAFEVYGVLKTGTTYRVDFAIDINDSGKYDGPPADAAWRRTVTATDTGNDMRPGARIWFWELPSNAEYVDVGF